MMPLLPICFETAVECTYPVSEESSSGFLMSMGNVVSIFVIIGLRYAIQDSFTCTTVFSTFSIAFMSLFAVAGTLLLFFDGPYLRMEAEVQQSIIDRDMNR